jgi:hypothetical protein
MEICPKAETPARDRFAGVGADHNRLAGLCGKNLFPVCDPRAGLIKSITWKVIAVFV